MATNAQPPKTKERHRWDFEFKSKALKQLEKMPKEDRLRCFMALSSLLKSIDPKTHGDTKKVLSFDNLYRHRQGDYRILFELQCGQKVIANLSYKGTLIIIEIALHHTGY